MAISWLFSCLSGILQSCTPDCNFPTCFCIVLGTFLFPIVEPVLPNLVASWKHFGPQPRTYLPSILCGQTRLGSRLLICNELCMPRLAVRIGSIVGRWYNRIVCVCVWVGELLALPLTLARVRFMARQIACNAYIIMIIIYYKANVYITRRLSKLCE